MGEPWLFRYINLPERGDRRERFAREFQDEPRFERAEGIRHPTPHVGCGLAHARTVREAFASSPHATVVVVLEDDAQLREGVAWRDVLAILEECSAYTDEWDAMSFGPQIVTTQALPSDVVDVAHSFVQCAPSFCVIGCVAMAWTRSALPFLALYEAELSRRQEAIPIDRVLFGGVWNAWGPVSAFSAPYDAQLTMEGGAHAVDAHTALRVWLCKRQLVFQTVGDVSDNTERQTPDVRALDDKGLAAICRKAVLPPAPPYSPSLAASDSSHTSVSATPMSASGVSSTK